MAESVVAPPLAPLLAMDTAEKFRRWFEEPIEALINKDEHTGFAVLMIALPLLERHIRRKLRITEDPLPLKFFEELKELFPQFVTRDNARRFWKCYRHGLFAPIRATAQGRSTSRSCP